MNANQTVLNDFISTHPFAAARSLALLTNEEVVLFLQTISFKKRAILFRLMTIEKAAAILILMPQNKAKELIENSDVSFIASVLKKIENPLRNELLNALLSKKRIIIKRQLAFLPNTVASIMESAVIAAKQMSHSEALELIKQSDKKDECYLYVISVDGIFEGIIRLRELLLADQKDSIEHLLIKNTPHFLSDIPIKNISNHPAWKEYQEIPVLDTSGKLLGKLPFRYTVNFKQKPNDNSSNEIAETGSALGDLYRIGIAGLLQGSGK